ncbi:hypothetical protein H2248_008074 [Termitomyces sp. 'cryptogamus']|nr:hypothetical protein H2248_008074 [Termitomyces sp. 'cryptogamus']
MHYFYVCTVRPGFVDEPPAEPGHNMLWAKMSRPRKGKALMGRVKWSSIVNVTPAETTQCSKCGQTKPETEWEYRVPALAYIIIYLLAAVLCLAVGIMLSYHVWSISCGETTVEGQDHEVYTKKAKSRGETFVNSYNLGRIRNLQLFLNIGEAG